MPGDDCPSGRPRRRLNVRKRIGDAMNAIYMPADQLNQYKNKPRDICKRNESSDKQSINGSLLLLLLLLFTSVLFLLF